MSKLNVLFLNSWYPNKIKPQNGNFIREHARSVSLYCNVICLQVQGVKQENDFKIVKENNNNVFEVTVYYNSVNSNNLFSLLSKRKRQHNAFLNGLKEINKIYKKIDIVHLNVIFPAGLFALYLKKKFNLPYIITEHSTIFLKATNHSLPLINKFLIKKIVSNSEIICPVSQRLKEGMLNNKLKGKYKIIPNTIDTSYFNYKPKVKSDIINILHVSSLKNDHKNIKGILNVIKKLSEIRSDFKFTILSSSNLDSVLEYSNKINLNKAFFCYKNNKTHKEVATAMQKSDLFLLFSNYETFSLVVPESLICGTPVITSKVGIVEDIINKENGVLVDIKDENKLLLELNKILNNITNYDNELISKKAIQKFCYEKVGKQFSELYTVILQD